MCAGAGGGLAQLHLGVMLVALGGDGADGTGLTGGRAVGGATALMSRPVLRAMVAATWLAQLRP